MGELHLLLYLPKGLKLKKDSCICSESLYHLLLIYTNKTCYKKFSVNLPSFKIFIHMFLYIFEHLSLEFSVKGYSFRGLYLLTSLTGHQFETTKSWTQMFLLCFNYWCNWARAQNLSHLNYFRDSYF